MRCGVIFANWNALWPCEIARRPRTADIAFILPFIIYACMFRSRPGGWRGETICGVRFLHHFCGLWGQQVTTINRGVNTWDRRGLCTGLEIQGVLGVDLRQPKNSVEGPARGLAATARAQRRIAPAGERLGERVVANTDVLDRDAAAKAGLAHPLLERAPDLWSCCIRPRQERPRGCRLDGSQLRSYFTHVIEVAGTKARRIR